MILTSAFCGWTASPTEPMIPRPRSQSSNGKKPAINMRRTQRNLCIARGSNYSHIIFALWPFGMYFSSFMSNVFLFCIKKGVAAILGLRYIPRSWGDRMKRCYRLECHIHSIGVVKIAYYSFLFFPMHVRNERKNKIFRFKRKKRALSGASSIRPDEYLTTSAINTQFIYSSDWLDLLYPASNDNTRLSSFCVYGLRSLFISLRKKS